MKRSDFLQRLIAIAGFGSFSPQSLISKRKIYLLQFFIAGFRHYKGMELLPFMEVNDLLELRREPNNEHDECAIALYWQQEKIGYIPYDFNEMPSRLLDAQALPLLGMITHLNREVKPWENIVAAVYFLQDESIEIPPHANYLTQLATPVYKTSAKANKEKLMNEIFENPNRIVDITTIKIDPIKRHFEKYYTTDKYKVMFKGRPYVKLSTDDIYTYMYNVNPLEWITADDGKKYILFDFIENPETDVYSLPSRLSPLQKNFFE